MWPCYADHWRHAVHALAHAINLISYCESPMLCISDIEYVQQRLMSGCAAQISEASLLFGRFVKGVRGSFGSYTRIRSGGSRSPWLAAAMRPSAASATCDASSSVMGRTATSYSPRTLAHHAAPAVGCQPSADGGAPTAGHQLAGRVLLVMSDP